MAPVTRQSGKTRTVLFRRVCNKAFREVMHRFGFCSPTRAPWARTDYDAKRAEGKGHAAALRCLDVRTPRRKSGACSYRIVLR